MLVHAPSSAFQAPGGGENQLVQTAWHLDALGLPVRPFGPWTDRLADARLIHLFGMSREGLELGRHNLVPELTANLDGIFWHPLSTDADMQVGRQLFPLAAAVERVQDQLDTLARTGALPLMTFT